MTIQKTYTVNEANAFFSTAIDCKGEAESMMIAAVKAAMDCGNALNNLADGEDGDFAGGIEVAEAWMVCASNREEIETSNTVARLYISMLIPAEPIEQFEQCEPTRSDNGSGGGVHPVEPTSQPVEADDAPQHSPAQPSAPVASPPAEKVEVKRKGRPRVRFRAATLPPGVMADASLAWLAGHAAAYECRQAIVALKKRISGLIAAAETAPIAQGLEFLKLVHSMDAADAQLRFKAPAYKCPIIMPEGRQCRICEDRGWISEEQYQGLTPELKEMVRK